MITSSIGSYRSPKKVRIKGIQNVFCCPPTHRKKRPYTSLPNFLSHRFCSRGERLWESKSKKVREMRPKINRITPPRQHIGDGVSLSFKEPRTEHSTRILNKNLFWTYILHKNVFEWRCCINFKNAPLFRATKTKLYLLYYFLCSFKARCDILLQLLFKHHLIGRSTSHYITKCVQVTLHKLQKRPSFQTLLTVLLRMQFLRTASRFCTFIKITIPNKKSKNVEESAWRSRVRALSVQNKKLVSHLHPHP